MLQLAGTQKVNGMRKHSYYLQLDEDFLEDPEVQLFIEEKGKEAVFDYLMLLLITRSYKNTDYMIPWTMIPIIARRQLMSTPEKLEDTVKYCLKINFFELYTDDFGERFFFSRRRQLDLRMWQVKSEKNRDAGIKGMQSRWKNRKKEDNEDED